jgi:hypothetical protein
MIYRRHTITRTALLPLIETSIILVLALSCACQSLNKRAPLSMESVISPADIYESKEVGSLVINYQSNLKNIYTNVRSRYKPNQLDFFLVSGICFSNMQVNRSYDTYLSLNTKSLKIFLDTKTTFDQRASVIFNNYTKPLLKIAAEERELFEDSKVAGIIINTRWRVKKTSGNLSLTLFEQIVLVTKKEQVDHCMEGAITDQELLDQSTLIAINEGENPHIINLHLE